MPFVEKWWCEHMNKLNEREAFFDSIGILGAEMKTEFLFNMFTGFCVSLVKREKLPCCG